MAKRAHFIDNDIEVFLNDANWEKTFNKRIENWKIARFPYDLTFVQKLFDKLASYKQSDASFTELLKKLDATGYPFQQSEFLPGTMHIGSLDDHFADTYIQLFSFMEEKGFKLNEQFKPQMFDMFKDTFNCKLVKFLYNKGVDVYWSNIQKLVRGLRMKATSNFMDMGAITRSSLGQLMFNKGAESPDRQLNQRFLDSLKESDTQENIELNFIVDYLNKNQLNKTQIEELERSLLPPQVRLQQKLFAETGVYDPFQMMQVGIEKKAKPRDWFNDSQLKIIDLVQPKYGLKIVE